MLDLPVNAETAGGTLGSGVLSAWLWQVAKARWPGLPDMPATVSPAIGAAIWQAWQVLLLFV